ncbi:MAG: 50S ribosomal protein L17 [Candidatus Omnitrophica bacterium]|nr:50S ribosomal protein L17 [Candidatus Omnitrophota bacterium]
MRHRRNTAKLGVKTAHRRALLAHIVEGLVEHERIRTTIDRAKEARRLAEHLITVAKQNTLHARRQILSALYSESIAKKLFERVAPAFRGVNGGYTRIIRQGARPGDGAQMVFLEFTQSIEAEAKPKTAKKEQAQKKKWEDIPLVKKEKIEEAKKEKEKSKKGDLLEEEKKKGGFLSKLRKFLKGEK